MSYCTAADIDIPLLELIQLCDDYVPLKATSAALESSLAGSDMTGYPAEIQSATLSVVERIDKAIADAAELVDGYVSGRYKTPLTVVPSLVKAIVVDIAVYRLYFRRKKKSVPEMVQKQYENALKLLRDIQSGRVVIGAAPSGETAAAVTSSIASFASSERIFNRASLGEL